MKEKKNIDRIYQEKFKDFEREPSEKVWDNIAARLDKKDKKKPLIIPLWWRIGGVAAVLAIILASLLFTENQFSNINDPEVVFENPEESEQDQNTETQQNEVKIKNSESEEAVAAKENSEILEKENSSSDNNSSESTGRESKVASAEKNRSKNSQQREKSSSAINSAIVTANSKSADKINEREKDAIQPEVINTGTSGEIAQNEKVEIDSTTAESILKEENALAQIEKEKQHKNDKEETDLEIDSKKMRLSSFAAPVFYKNIGSGNELSNQLADNSSSSEVTLSYGIKVAYQISKKLRIRTGISKVDISNNIRDISYSPAMASRFENLSPMGDNIDIRDTNSPESGLPMGATDQNNSLTTAVFTPGEIRQQFGYIEVPLELEYSLIDSRFGLNIIGGGSSLFLDNNRVDLVSGNAKTNLGEATNINSTSFSTNIGVGMDYKLTDKFSISVEPIFKYQLNTFNNVDNVQPVNFGVYSGLNFRF